jgi:hypothetical protein
VKSKATDPEPLDVFKIVYRNKAWSISSERYYSARSIGEALEDFMHCFNKNRLNSIQLKIIKIRKYNRFNDTWEVVDGEAAEYAREHIDRDEFKIIINDRNIIRLRRHEI